jgi:peptide/nickel transport system permease protein
MSTPLELGSADPSVLAAATDGWGARLRRGARHHLARRLLGALVTLVGVSILVFIVLHVVPGNQITASLGTETGVLTPAQRSALEHYYGVDRSLPAQYLSWLWSILNGNLGYSLTSGQSVASLTASALPVTLELAVLATLFGSITGVVFGLLAASRPNSVRDTVSQGVGLFGLAVPSFVLATAIVTVLADKLHYFPNGGDYRTPLENPWTNFQQMVFPALVLGIGVAAPVMRTTRSAVLEVSSKDFVRSARGKGLSPARVLVRHVLHNAAIPIVTITGIQFGYLLGGAVIVEQIFALPGLGRQVLTAIQQREYATVQSTVLVIAAAFVLVNLLTDLLYRRLDPRVRAS